VHLVVADGSAPAATANPSHDPLRRRPTLIHSVALLVLRSVEAPVPCERQVRREALGLAGRLGRHSGGSLLQPLLAPFGTAPGGGAFRLSGGALLVIGDLPNLVYDVCRDSR
jgi:hypothetical protein